MIQRMTEKDVSFVAAGTQKCPQDDEFMLHIHSDLLHHSFILCCHDANATFLFIICRHPRSPEYSNG